MLKFEANNNKKYKVKIIQNNKVYVKKVRGHLSELYYLVILKSYLEKKNIWKPS